jgi:hypothetical protein
MPPAHQLAKKMRGGKSLSHLGAADYLEKSKAGTIDTAGFSCFLITDI